MQIFVYHMLFQRDKMKLRAVKFSMISLAKLALDNFKLS